MSLKPQRIAGASWLLLAAVLAAKKSYYSFTDFRQDIQFFTWLFPNVVYSQAVQSLAYLPVSILAILAAIFAFLNKGKVSAILALGAMFFWIISTFLRVFNYLSYFEDSSVPTAIQIHTFGRDGAEVWAKLGLSPTFVTLMVGLVLVVIGGNQSQVSQIADTKIRQASPKYLPPVSQTASTPLLPFGMKKCPECAELIQAEAIKCRFCNYRYQ